MPIDKVGHQRNTPVGRHIRETDQARMSNAVQVNKFSEVSVDRYENPVVGVCAFKQGAVTRIGTERTRFENIVSFTAQPGRQLCARAPINEEFHCSTTVTADKVSPATTACAYAVHARISSGSRSG